jgi:hypothetical protein
MDYKMEAIIKKKFWCPELSRKNYEANEIVLGLPVIMVKQ